MNNPEDFTVMDTELATLQQQIADEYARADVECKARFVPGSQRNRPVYDTSRPEDARFRDPEILDEHQRDVERAVRYLDLRGLITRPMADRPHLVSFGAST